MLQENTGKPEVKVEAKPATFAEEINNSFDKGVNDVAPVDVVDEPVVNEAENRVAELEAMLKAKNEADSSNNQVIDALKSVLGEKPKGPTEEELLDDLQFSDPPEYRRRLIESLKKELKEENAKAKSTDDFWDQYYIENKDLAPHRDLVKLITDSEMKNLSAMDAGEAGKIVATKARAMISKMGIGSNTKTETVGNANTTVLGSSFASKTAPVTETKASTFIDQVKNFQNRK